MVSRGFGSSLLFSAQGERRKEKKCSPKNLPVKRGRGGIPPTPVSGRGIYLVLMRRAGLAPAKVIDRVIYSHVRLLLRHRRNSAQYAAFFPMLQYFHGTQAGGPRSGTLRYNLLHRAFHRARGKFASRADSTHKLQ